MDAAVQADTHARGWLGRTTRLRQECAPSAITTSSQTVSLVSRAISLTEVSCRGQVWKFRGHFPLFNSGDPKDASSMRRPIFGQARRFSHEQPVLRLLVMVLILQDKARTPKEWPPGVATSLGARSQRHGRRAWPARDTVELDAHVRWLLRCVEVSRYPVRLRFDCVL